MLLVDTSVRADHFRGASARLAALLEAGEVLCHPFVIGELACGDLRNRAEVLALLSALAPAPKVDDGEILYFIDRHALAGRGIGRIDVHLLASCRLRGVRLWTADRRLARIAGELGIDA